MRAFAACLFVAFALAPTLSRAQAPIVPPPSQPLYKLIAKDGRITYSDHAPKQFEGQVIRLEPYTESNVVPSKRTPANATPPAGPSPYAVKRAADREALEKALREARAKVDAARKAKADGGEPGDDEMQVIQRRFAPLKAGQDPPRSNCRNATDSEGRPYLLCASQVPGEAFYERQKKLDAELDDALAQLAEAERAYRRGAD
jgi:hypothetical protein